MEVNGELRASGIGSQAAQIPEAVLGSADGIEPVESAGSFFSAIHQDTASFVKSAHTSSIPVQTPSATVTSGTMRLRYNLVLTVVFAMFAGSRL